MMLLGREFHMSPDAVKKLPLSTREKFVATAVWMCNERARGSKK
jgi:hypothetical protein